VGAVEALLDNGFCHVNTRVLSLSPLMYAAFNGNLKVVKYLVHNGADVYLLSSSLNPRPAVYYALSQGNVETALFLFKKMLEVPPQKRKIENEILSKDIHSLEEIQKSTGLSEREKEMKFKLYILEKKIVPYGALSPEGLTWLKTMSAEGNAEAQYLLGICYMKGLRGLKPDSVEAFKCFSKAVKQHYGQAERPLRHCYHEFGLTSNPKEVNFLKSLADKGDPEAQYQFAFNSLINKNNAAYRKYIVMAAENGHIKAQCILGDLYATGSHGLKKDLNMAVKWYGKALAATKDQALKNELQKKIGLYSGTGQ